LAFLLACSVCTAKTIYVDDNAAGVNDGTSWQNAYTFLQDALVDAYLAEKPVEIRVAQGIYTPDQGAFLTPGYRNLSFQLLNGVTLAGGYAGNGEPDPDARDIKLFETILSGDLNGDDEPVADPYDLFKEADEGSRFDNTYNVVTANNTDETAVLDGFTITAGIANYDYIYGRPQSKGGGLYCCQSEPVITNCKFTFNAAREAGAMFNNNSSPRLIDCRFDKNAAISDEYGYGGSGGGILNFCSSPVLTNCTFTENYSSSGGGMYNYGNGEPALTNCLFTQNMARNTGGGMKNYYCSPILTGCSFEGNSANVGGGLHNSFSTPILTGCTFIENHASSDGGGIANDDSEPNITDCEFISNIANGGGGAISNDSCMNLVINNCTFSDNSACSGATMQNLYSNLSITGSSFAGNAAFEGGAMQNWFSELTIINSLFTGNASQQGCSIQSYECNLTLTNCTINGNATKIYDGGISGSSQDNQDTSGALPGLPDDEIQNFDPNPSHIECTNCIIWDDVNSIRNNDGSTIIISYSNIRDGFDGEDNISEDPLFVSPGNWADINDPNIIVGPNNPNAVWIDGDYHLKSQAGRFDPNIGNRVIDDVTSPCIDAGDPNSPVGDEPEPNGGRINMGAYGGTSEASMSPEQPESSPLVAHWKLDEIEGDIAYDSAGNHNATVHRGTWTDGRIDGALLFNGLNTYMNCGDSQSLRPEEMTLSLWL